MVRALKKQNDRIKIAPIAQNYFIFLQHIYGFVVSLAVKVSLPHQRRIQLEVGLPFQIPLLM